MKIETVILQNLANDDEYMRKFYRKFMESEAGHYTLFIDLCDTYFPKTKVRNLKKIQLFVKIVPDRLARNNLKMRFQGQKDVINENIFKQKL